MILSILPKEKLNRLATEAVPTSSDDCHSRLVYWHNLSFHLFFIACRPWDFMSVFVNSLVFLLKGIYLFVKIPLFTLNGTELAISMLLSVCSNWDDLTSDLCLWNAPFGEYRMWKSIRHVVTLMQLIEMKCPWPAVGQYRPRISTPQYGLCYDATFCWVGIYLLEKQNEQK